MTTDTGEIIWRPTPEVIERARITRLMRAHAIPSLDALRRRALDDLEWYWDAVARDLEVRWSEPYARVLDGSRGIAYRAGDRATPCLSERRCRSR